MGKEKPAENSIWVESIHLPPAMRLLAEQTRTAMEQVLETPEEVQMRWQQMEKAVVRLANVGWTLPMRMTPRQAVKLTVQLQTDDEIDDWMLKYYDRDDSSALRSMRQELLRRPKIAKWQRLVDQCFEAYRRRIYLVAIPALLSVVEGLVAQEQEERKQGRPNVIIMAELRQKSSQLGSVDNLIWLSARIFIENLFASSDFKGPRPPQINRHWILHGRDHTQWKQIDTLRLLHAVNTLAATYQMSP
jgi:hypothetical protein